VGMVSMAIFFSSAGFLGEQERRLRITAGMRIKNTFFIRIRV